MDKKTQIRLRSLIRESIKEAIAQEYRTKKVQEPQEEEPEWMKGLELTMDDVKAMFDEGPKYNDNEAGGDYEIDSSNPTFYVNGKEMSADSISPFHNGFAIVKCNGQQGFINKNGELLGGKFYSRCDDFEDGWGLVVDETGKRNFINGEGEYLLPNWVTRASSFMGGEAVIMDDGKRYKIDPEGNVISENKQKKDVLREYDEPFPYDYTDARERDAYFERAVKHDFPAEGRYKTARTWEDMYYELLSKKQAADKESKKATRKKERDEKRQANLQKKSDIRAKKERRNRLWALAVEEAAAGSNNQNDEYDGIMDLPIVLNDGQTVIFHVHSFMGMNDEEYNKMADAWNVPGKYEVDAFSVGLAGDIDGQENFEELYFTVKTYAEPLDVEVGLVKSTIEGVARIQTKKALTDIIKKEAIRRYKKLAKNNG